MKKNDIICQRIALTGYCSYSDCNHRVPHKAHKEVAYEVKPYKLCPICSEIKEVGSVKNEN